MKVIKTVPATLKRPTRVTVELQPGEALAGIHNDRYYRLGGQVEDIVQGHVITEVQPVYWCSISQKWEHA